MNFIDKKSILYSRMSNDDEPAVKEIVEDIENHGGKEINITDIGIDFGPAFVSGVTKYMPKAPTVSG
ncbi:MAG: hypothetical protein Q9M97_01880 [Candidatus Gracilibacteria bacterium]|nr:hypothetical protein [Candidatus Gracilibacteria bacterium]